MCVNKPKSGSGVTSCSVDHHVSGCDNFGTVSMIVLLSQQNLVSKIALKPLEMHIASVYCVAGTKMQY